MTPNRWKLSIRVAGDELDPDAVTQVLSINPDHSHRRGEPHLSKDGKRAYSTWRTGQWSLSSPEPDEAPLDRHLAWAEAVIAPRVDAFRQLLSQGVEIDLFVGAFAEATNFGIVVELAKYPAICHLGLLLGFDIYAWKAPDADTTGIGNQ